MKTKFTAFLSVVTLLCLLAPVSVPAGTISYTYDNTGRLTGADYGGGRTIQYTYDNNGNLLKRVVGTPTPGQYTLTVAASPTDRGSVTGNGIDCPGDCTHDYDENTAVQLTATPTSGNKFLRWKGSLTGTTNPGTVTMSGDKETTAYFGATSGNTDTDGVPDGTESGPGGDDPAYDGNGNGIPDYQEAGVTSLPSVSGGAYATVAGADGSGQTLSNVQAANNPSPGDAPEGIQFPYGFFIFSIDNLANPGDAAVATLYLPKNASLNTYYLYGPTPDDTTNHWYEFMYDGETGAEILQDAARTRVVLHFKDGERGDKDLTANGRIDDPGAPGIVSGSPIPTLNEWGLILFTVCLLVMAIVTRRKING
jgi:YD repeat-containing protein